MNCKEAEFRKALGQFVTGICIMTITDEHTQAIGITVNSFCSVSLEPPLILFCLKKTAESFVKFTTAKYWGVNILSETQKSLSQRATRRGGEILHFADYTTKTFNVPLLNESVASLICKRVNQMSAGDHNIILGRVIETNCSSNRKPLVYFHKSYNKLTENL